MSQSVNLPIVDTFSRPYKKWKKRPATTAEMLANGCPDPIKEELIACVSDARAAAEYMARVRVDNALSNHVQEALDSSKEYKTWRREMPSKTPDDISLYQKNFSNCDLDRVSKAVELHGRFLSPGQCIFHGGLWIGKSKLVTQRPFSTSLCPQVALRNAEYNGKAYDSDRLDLIVLRATDPAPKAFVFKRKGTTLGHENEVLLASGTTLTLKCKTLVCSNYPVAKVDCGKKSIPIYVLEIEASLGSEG